MSAGTIVLRVTEFVLLFIFLPLVYYFNLLPFPKIGTLMAVTALCILILKLDPSCKLGNMISWPEHRIDWKKIMIRSAGVASGIFVLVIVSHPETLFSFPKELPGVWIAVMALYPVVSVLPQEVIYRVYFFERYRSVISGETQLVMLNAFSFAFLHIIYDNWWAVALSFVGGIIFSRTYQKSQSLWWVSLEHAVYGWLIFTIGMGEYFYEAL